MTQYRRMPDGTLSADANAYCDAWAKEAEIVEEMFPGFRLEAYNPGFVFDNGQGIRFDLPKPAIDALRLAMRHLKEGR